MLFIMKKLFFALFALSLFLLVACTAPDTTAAAGTTALSPTSSSVKTTEEITTVQTTEQGILALPKEYDRYPGELVNGSKIVIPAKDNLGLAFDIDPVIENDTVYFLLPSAVDLRQVAYLILDASGNVRAGRAADFTSDDPTNKTARIFGENYPIVCIRSDSPTLYLEIDESYGTIWDVKADENKNTKAYGSFVLECRKDIAEKYGWQTHYESVENDPDSPCTAYIKGRGNWTWYGSEKQGYSIKLEKKTDLLGMGKSKKWALIGNVPDPTMLRNKLAYYLGREVGLDYSPEGEIVDFFVNGEYFGAFLLSEKIDIEEERVNIADLEGKIQNTDPTESYGKKRQAWLHEIGVVIKYYDGVKDPEDITGGYIIEMEMQDRYNLEPCGFVTSHQNYYVIKSPEYASRAQVSYIATLVENMETALYAKDGIHPTTALRYTDYIDLDSLVKKYWVEEISKNHDGAKTSQYFYKPADSQSTKLFAGPVWDYDIAFGVSSETTNAEGWFMRTNKAFFKSCWQHDDFCRRAEEIFLTEFKPAMKAFTDTLAYEEIEKIRASLDMNYIVWDQLGGKTVDTYLDWLIKYLERRMLWIEKQFN